MCVYVCVYVFVCESVGVHLSLSLSLSLSRFLSLTHSLSFSLSLSSLSLSLSHISHIFVYYCLQFTQMGVGNIAAQFLASSGSMVCLHFLFDLFALALLARSMSLSGDGVNKRAR
jgi:hypothetical protein